MAHLLTNKEFEIVTSLRFNMLAKYAGADTSWYCGITNDIQRRLFDEHNVDEEKGVYFFWDAETKESADRVEQYVLKKFPKMAGHGGLGKEDSVYVYVYKVEDSTKEKTNEGLDFDDRDLILG